jgi:hypothetical protein
VTDFGEKHAAGLDGRLRRSDDTAQRRSVEAERDRAVTTAWRTRTRTVGSRGATSDRAVRTGPPVGALWRGRMRGSPAAVHGARWRWRSYAWALVR